MTRATLLCAALCLFGYLPACTQVSKPKPAPLQDTPAAERLSREAADLIYSKPREAEALLLKALAADQFYGPAYNNLGVVYLRGNDLYKAATEFETARKLMPGNPEPRQNLAMTYERAGRTPEALESYRAALEAQGDHIASIQGLTRLEVSTGKADPATAARLEIIALRGTTPAWREWARLELAKHR